MANKFSLISLGCPKNLVDSDTLTRKLSRSGFSYHIFPEKADILLINTCSFIEDAKKESIEEILRLAGIKKKSRLIVFGCLAKRYKDKLTEEIPEIDAIFGVGEDEKIVKYCKNLVRRRRSAKAQKDKKRGKQNFLTSRLPDFCSFYAYLKIADGCDKKCSYCVIPSIRGNYKSASQDKIIREAKRHLNRGVKELILVAQDTACYGKDLNPAGDNDLSSLLKKLCSIKGDFWIRLLYAYPASISGTLLKTIAEEDKICKYLDIPLQHSEDRILKLMKRGGSRKSYLTLIKKIREAIPDITLRTTFISGFPSETEKEFRSLIDFIEKAQFDRLGVFKYSKEEGTPASKLKKQVTDEIKKQRVEEIMKHQARISLEKNRELIGKQFRVIIDEVSYGAAIGRLYSHAPEIDGVVIIERAEEQRNRSEEAKGFLTSRVEAGDFVNVEITDAFEYDLKGKIVL